jgi:uncharacterized protein YutE (UPF0331/DUF86 family)
MSPLNKNGLRDKLFKLNESIKIIEELLGRDEVIKDNILKSSLYFNLVISIEIILDIGNHILAESFNKPASNYQDIILGLGDKGVVPLDFAKDNQKMGDFRNKIIHDYDRIDDKQAYEYAVKAPEVFKSFAKSFVEFIDKENIKN